MLELIVAASLVCTAEADTLVGAREAFVEACPFLERVDCDPIGDTWQCSTVMIGDFAPGYSESIVREGADPDDPAAVSDGLMAGTCSVMATTLGGARSLYESTCSDVRRDCDPMDGQWTCASFTIGSVASSTKTPTIVVPSTPDAVEPIIEESTTEPTLTTRDLVSTGISSPITPAVSWADSYMDSEGLCWIRSTFDHSAGDLQVTVASGRTITVRQARDELGAGPGQHGDLAFNDVQCGHGPANSAGDEDINQCPGLVTRGSAGCSLRARDGLWSDRL